MPRVAPKREHVGERPAAAARRARGAAARAPGRSPAGSPGSPWPGRESVVVAGVEVDRGGAADQARRCRPRRGRCAGRATVSVAAWRVGGVVQRREAPRPRPSTTCGSVRVVADGGGPAGRLRSTRVARAIAGVGRRPASRVACRSSSARPRLHGRGRCRPRSGRSMIVLRGDRVDLGEEQLGLRHLVLVELGTSAASRPAPRR